MKVAALLHILRMDVTLVNLIRYDEAWRPDLAYNWPILPHQCRGIGLTLYESFTHHHGRIPVFDNAL